MALRFANDLEFMCPKEAVKALHKGYAKTLMYTRFPMGHWRRIRMNNAIERLKSPELIPGP